MFIGEQCSVEYFGLIFHGYISDVTDDYVEIHHDPFDINVEIPTAIYTGTGVDRFSNVYGYASRHINCSGCKLGETSEKRIDASIKEYAKAKRYWIITASFIYLDASIKSVIVLDYSTMKPYAQDREEIIRDCRRAYHRLIDNGYSEEDLQTLLNLTLTEVETLSDNEYSMWMEGDIVGVETLTAKFDGYISYAYDGVIKVRYDPYSVTGTLSTNETEIVLYEQDIVHMQLIVPNSKTFFVKAIEDGRADYKKAIQCIAILNKLHDSCELPEMSSGVEDAVLNRKPTAVPYKSLLGYFKLAAKQNPGAMDGVASSLGLSPSELDYILR